jgi:hypothetical protein
MSASNAARDRNSPVKAHQINLQRSFIGSEYQPIRGRGQPFWVCGRDTHLVDKEFVQRANTAVLLGILWAGLAVCVIGALAYDIAYWLQNW